MTSFKVVSKLSRLEIDVDKDWSAHVIKNLGSPSASGDAVPLGFLKLPYDYIIYEEGGSFKAFNCDSQTVEFTETDFAAAVNDALNALTGGGIVFIKPGTYDIYDTIVLNNDGLILTGGGPLSTILTQQADVDVIKINDNVDYCVVANLGITSAITPTSGVGIRIRGRLNTIFNVNIEKTYKGVYIDGNGDVTPKIYAYFNLIIRVRASECVDRGFDHNTDQALYSRNTTFIACEAINCGSDGFRLTHDCQVIGGQSYGNDNEGFWAVGAKNVLMTFGEGNASERTRGRGIVIYDRGGSGIEFTDPSYGPAPGGFGYSGFYQYIASHAHLHPDADNKWALGSSSLRWSNLYAVTTTIGDLGLTEKTCAVCGKPFKLGDKVKFVVKRADEEGIKVVPVHEECGA